MSTQILAPGTGSGESTPFDVVPGAPANIGFYRADGSRIERTCVAVVKREDPNGVFQPTSYSINRDVPNLVIFGAGTYKAYRSGSFNTDTGIMLD